MDTTEVTNLSDGRYLKGSLSILQEFYLEFFGTLIPGILAVTATILLGMGFYYCVTGDMALIRETGFRLAKHVSTRQLALPFCAMDGCLHP